MCDQTASSFPLKYIENSLQKYVYPFYTNTHSNNYFGRLMSKYLKTSKKFILKCMHGNPDNDCVIFTGSGCSGAINHLVHLIKPKLYNAIIFVSIYEHYSNYLPWIELSKETGLTLKIIDIDSNGLLDLVQLKHELTNTSHHNIFISVSACSNVTGVLQDIQSISTLARDFNAHLFFDYATSAPYTDIRMDLCDAVFISPHKFPGGQSTPGLLVCKKSLVCNSISYTPSGGTVRFACSKSFVYNPNIEVKENGGTPNILGIIKTALVFHIKQQYSHEIYHDELSLTNTFQKGLLHIQHKCNNLVILNPIHNIHRLPIFAIQIRKNNTEFYHYNYIVALLNDLFHITTRGGVSCSGVFAEKLLHLTDSDTTQIRQSILNNHGVPSHYGWIRITLNSIHSKKDIRTILKAIHHICKYAYKYKSLYQYDCKSNLYCKI
jgi:selenocysteine lyase/cysteine desulfurase